MNHPSLHTRLALHSTPHLCAHQTGLHAVGERHLLLLINKANTAEELDTAMKLVQINWLRRGRVRLYKQHSPMLPHALLRVSTTRVAPARPSHQPGMQHTPRSTSADTSTDQMFGHHGVDMGAAAAVHSGSGNKAPLS
jgi:hypothetical protein